MEPAKNIIALCGGIAEVAKITGRNEIQVRRWTYPKAKGGTDGRIPSDAAALLMRAARDRSLPLEPQHFFPEAAA